jgi:aspartyl-tRNA(Asn)/glutamyl-tRNA(Gln) amidotransferase subunit A
MRCFSGSGSSIGAERISGEEMSHRRSFQVLRERYASGGLSPVQVVESALDHAALVDARLNVFALLDHRRALLTAARSEARWNAGQPLSAIDGMPITVKEYAAVQGWPTRRGSLVSSDQLLTESTVFVQRLEDAGAVIIGKTRAPEFNWKGVTDSPGFGITRNPWNTALTPGGSSGGCSAAVASGVTRVSMGSDAAGSVRIPAAFCGVVGLKPTFGRIPAVPSPSAYLNVVHSGPIAACVGDLADVLKVVAGPSHRDWTSMGLAEATHTATVERMRIGLLKPARWSGSDVLVRAGMQEMLELLTANGLDVQEVDYDVAEASEAAALLYRLGCAAAVRAVAPGDRAKLDLGLVRFVHAAEQVRLQDLQAALKQRDDASNQLNELFEQVDVLMLPTTPIAAFAAGRDVPDGWVGADWMSWNPYTPAFNLSGVPAMSYPVWPAGSPLPIGVQFVAPRCREDVLIGLGEWLERRLPIRTLGDDERAA